LNAIIFCFLFVFIYVCNAYFDVNIKIFYAVYYVDEFFSIDATFFNNFI